MLQTTGSAAQTGITGFFTILPVVVAGFFGGTLVDRMGYRRTSIVADLASGLTVALIPLLHFTIGLEFWQLMVLVFLGGLLDAPGSTARTALIPDLAARRRFHWRGNVLGQVVGADHA
jgi:MFS family permease